MSLTLPSDTDSDPSFDALSAVVALAEIRERLAEVLAGLSYPRPSDIAARAATDLGSGEAQ